jgi:hypothetical protein
VARPAPAGLASLTPSDVTEADAGIDAVCDVGQVVVDDHIHPNIGCDATTWAGNADGTVSDEEVSYYRHRVNGS